jgi:serralysin
MLRTVQQVRSIVAANFEKSSYYRRVKMALNTINGTHGNDTLTGTCGNDLIYGFAGNDVLQGLGGKDVLFGGDGADSVNGGSGNDFIDGGLGVDTLTGGSGADSFNFSDPFFPNGLSAATPAPNGIGVINQPDVITDYQIGKDKFVFETGQLGFDPGEPIDFQSGISSQLSGDSNVIVLEDPFPNAAAAAQAIANNDAITSDSGIFVYYNSTLGFTRVVYSNDLGDGGPISVVANLTNLTDPNSPSNFSSQDFTAITLT